MTLPWAATPAIDLTPRPWIRAESATFRKTREANGGLSNMAGGFPMYVMNSDGEKISVKWSEASYQAMRFVKHPHVQEQILKDVSPMGCKLVCTPYLHLTRPDWGRERHEYGVRLDAMWWSLLVKLACNMEKFGEVIEATGSRPIVEDSSKDPYWGAVPNANDDILFGANVLGQMQNQLKLHLRTYGDEMRQVPSPKFPDAILYGKALVGFTVGKPAPKEDTSTKPQLSLF